MALYKKCNCISVAPPSTPKVCDGCFHLNNLILLPKDSISACGESGYIDLFDKLSPVGCSKENLTFVISSYSKGVTNVSIQNTSELHFTSVPELSQNSFSSVTIKAYCSGTEFSTFFNVSIGFKNLCVDSACKTCNPCTGNCVTAISASLSKTCGQSFTYDAKTNSVITGCTGQVTYEIVSSSPHLNVAISNAGVISGTVSANPPHEISLPIKYRISCNPYGMISEGIINVIVPNLCNGQTWNIKEVCNKCTGEITKINSDIKIFGRSVGFTNNNGTTFINN